MEDMKIYNAIVGAKMAATIAGTDNYNQPSNQPKINSITLTGNKTSSDLGLQPALNTAQTNAVNSGITAALTEQISTNQTNISAFHKASGTDIYFSETEPTGTITDGSYWISTTATKIYDLSPNLYDYTATDSDNGYINNAWLKNDNTTNAEDGYTVSEYIEIKPNTDYYLNTVVTIRTPAYCFYDDTKTYITGSSYDLQNPIVITSPVNAKYIRLSVPTSVQTTFALREGSNGHKWS